ncbi:histone-lysine N-methyltransferase PRDM9-like [Frankliniella occidentalis]|uniref:Histone-lysine N-methyltransferase PRDM9-like n=1 Tax=Frankliniella occidentalis TaxID=133901 RepID=A0A9C6X238_FRAOC|nr:histone-lysine N-methyltransferase PRDM9-like [Frankliniella occidentalis]
MVGSGNACIACFQCDEDFSLWDNFNSHYLRAHSDAQSALCAVCLGIPLHPMESHLKAHELVADKFRCPYCSAKLLDDRKLTEHLRIFHRRFVRQTSHLCTKGVPQHAQPTEHTFEVLHCSFIGLVCR